MNYAIQNLNYENRELRMMEIDGEPWWVAKDVCDILDLKNSRDAVSSLEEDEKGVGNADTLGGAQNVQIVNESGLYNLIFKSRTTAAQNFRRWVTHKVLPQIRRTGVFMAAGELSPEVAELVSLEYRLAAVKKRLEARELDCKAKLVYQLDGAVAIGVWLREYYPKMSDRQLANETRSIKRAIINQLRRPCGIVRGNGNKVISALPADIQAAVDLLKTTRKGLK